MRPVLLLVAVFLAAGCGAGETEPGGGEATGSVEEPTGSLPQDERIARKPPALEFGSEAGRQRAAQGTYCISDPDAGVGECLNYEAAVGPEHVSVGLVVDETAPLEVRPGGPPAVCADQ